ncbi:GNVR domain-containing protein [Colwellia sp. RE-S-Sl-9]
MNNISEHESNLFDLGRLIAYLVSKWKWFLVIGFVVAGVFAYISIDLPNQYTSEILLTEADDETSGLDGMSGQLGGLASLAGINVGNSKKNKLVALQILKSRRFLVDFVKFNKLEVKLFAVKKWDITTDKYVYYEDKYDKENGVWLQRADKPISYYPTDLEIHELVKSSLTVDMDTTNRVTKISFTSLNPNDAQLLLSKLIKTLNNELRQDDLSRGEKQIAFLQHQLELERNAGIRNVYYSLIEEQIKSLTLAKARNEYIFKVIDPAIFPEEKSSPKRALITVLGGFIGGILCFIFFSIRYLLKSN